MDVKAYCCNDDMKCCRGKCCNKDSYCCSQHSPEPNAPPVCCPSSSHCCSNSRGEVVCCPELVKQIWIVIAIILLVYTTAKISRALKVYCNMVPFEDDNIKILDEDEVKKMKYCFFGCDTHALKRGKYDKILSLWSTTGKFGDLVGDVYLQATVS